MEPAASVMSGVTVTAAVRRKAGATSWTGTVTFQRSPGSSSGGAAMPAASVPSVPKGAVRLTSWVPESRALPVL